MWRSLRDGLSGTHRFAEFLPDAEGVVERRHSPVAGLLILTIALVFSGLLAWAGLTEVEQIVRAQGQIEPAGRVKIVNHPDGGRIAAIHVVEGQRVTAGAPLVTFDAEQVRARLAELTGRWQLRSLETARLEAEAWGGEMVLDPKLVAERPDLVLGQVKLLESRRQAQASHLEALAQTIERRSNDGETIAAELVRLRNSHALLAKQLGAIRGLAEKGLYPRLRLVAVERQLSDLAGDIAKTRERREAAAAALAAAKADHDGVDREWRSTVLAELAAAKAERDRLAEARKRQAATLRHLIVRAPVDGIVQDLAVTSVGEAAGSNQPLMKLVPTGEGLVVQARVANKDIGYVRLGQPAKIKVETYDFLRFGTLAGEIERIDADATLDPRRGEPSYGITVRAESAELTRGGERVSVLPGMAVEVDLMVGERTILSYLTDRIFRLREDAFRDG